MVTTKKIFLQKLKLKGISLWLMFEGLVVGVARGDETVVNFRFLLTSASLLVFFKSSAVSFQSRLSLAYAIRNAPFHTCVLSWALKEKKKMLLLPFLIWCGRFAAAQTPSLYTMTHSERTSPSLSHYSVRFSSFLSIQESSTCFRTGIEGLNLFIFLLTE